MSHVVAILTVMISFIVMSVVSIWIREEWKRLVKRRQFLNRSNEFRLRTSNICHTLSLIAWHTFLFVEISGLLIFNDLYVVYAWGRATEDFLIGIGIGVGVLVSWLVICTVIILILLYPFNLFLKQEVLRLQLLLAIQYLLHIWTQSVVCIRQTHHIKMLTYTVLVAFFVH